MAKNVGESDFISGDRSMTFGRKHLADGSIAETRRHMNKRDISEESKFFMKQARKVLWQHLRGTPLKTGKHILVCHHHHQYYHNHNYCLFFILSSTQGSLFRLHVGVRS